MTLETELAAQRQRAYEERSPEERLVRAGAVAAVADAQIPARALGVGELIPRIELPDAAGHTVEVARLLADGPLVISFYRGGWCPYCNLELRALQQRLGALRALGASLVAISPELPDRSLTTAQKNSLEYPVLSDKGNEVARQFRLPHRIDPQIVRYQLGNGNDVAAFNGSDVAEVPLPATYVVGTDGIVRFAFVSADYTQRAEPDAVVGAVRELTAR
jgi:peroxiredoxin